jgi:hypothetical protein
MTIKHKCANLVVEYDMEEGISISIQLETIVVPTTTTLNLVGKMEDLGVDVRVE